MAADARPADASLYTAPHRSHRAAWREHRPMALDVAALPVVTPAAHRLAAWMVATATVATLLLAGCATRSPYGADGPALNPPAGIDDTPDAVPRIEPLRIGGPNKPYEIFGHRYVPVTDDEPLVQTGLASWYGRKFHGLPTSSGEIFDMHAMTAAHRTMPIPSYARVRNPANGREVTVRINDRGPFSDGRVIDLSYAAARRLDLLRGVAPVQIERLTFAQISAGAVRGPGATAATAADPVSAGSTPPVLANLAANPQAGSPGAPIEVVTPVRIGPAGAPAAAAAQVSATAFVPVPTAGAVAESRPVAAAAPIAVSALPATDKPAASEPPDGPPLSGWWLQLGAFRQRDSAQQLQQRTQRDVGGLPAVAIFEGGALYRVQVGPYASQNLALDAAARLRQGTGIAPVLIERSAAGQPLAAR